MLFVLLSIETGSRGALPPPAKQALSGKSCELKLKLFFVMYSPIMIGRADERVRVNSEPAIVLDSFARCTMRFLCSLSISL